VTAAEHPGWHSGVRWAKRYKRADGQARGIVFIALAIRGSRSISFLLRHFSTIRSLKDCHSGTAFCPVGGEGEKSGGYMA
jgi:hypothetical protein